jgi:hypothetical protein
MTASEGAVRRCSVILIFVWSLLLASNSNAECDCAEVSNKDSFKCHRAVFVGSVLEDGDATRVVVEEVFKGRLPVEVIVSAMGECRIWFQAGRRYLFEVYYEEADQSTLRTSICSHTRALDDPRTIARVAELRHRAWWWRLPLSGWCRNR